MNTRILLLLALLGSPFARAAESGPGEPPIQSPAAAQSAPATIPKETVGFKASEEFAKTGNDFLRLALSKAEKYSGKVEDAVGASVDFAVKEAPETARQYLTWHFYRHLIKGLVPLVVGLLSVGALIYSIKRTDWSSREFDGRFLWALIGGVGALICLLAFFASPGSASSGLDHLMSCIQIKVAPRIYLIEEVSKLLHR